GSDGVKYVYVRFKDAAGNISSVKSDSIILDTKPPALTQSAATKTPTQNNSKTVSGSKEAGSRLTLSIPEGAPFTATLTATDAGSSWSCLLDGLTEGTNSITLIATDAAGNGTNLPVEVIRDTAKPAGTLLVKGTNADDSMTKSTAVTLALTADGTGSNPAYMRFSNNGTTWSSWEAYKPARTWTLPTGNGEKNVYAMVKDSAGNESDPFSDSIVLDATAPKGAVSINDGATWSKSGDVALRLTATDVGSSVVKMQINSVNSWTNVSWEDYAPTRDWTLAGTDGKKYVYARFMDAAGNISTAVMDSIVVDTVLPALAVTSPVTLQTVLDSRSFKGTKGAGATLSVSASTGATVTPVLNSPAATSWTYAISNFEEGENVITFTAADAAGNEKQVAVTVTFTPFKTSDMAGTWHLNGVSSGGTLEGNLSGTLTLDEFGT
ncbi:hypothetical protein EG834_12690, partial [bacterium]|nr:hypothetical protein [bacterium]